MFAQYSSIAQPLVNFSQFTNETMTLYNNLPSTFYVFHHKANAICCFKHVGLVYLMLINAKFIYVSDLESSG
jgi:hypothetical protein